MDLQNRLLDFFFPPRCFGCNAVTAGEFLCSSCAPLLTECCFEQPLCLRCGLPKSLCLCGSRNFYYDRMLAGYYYTGVVKNGLKAVKFRSNTRHLQYFSAMLSQQIQQLFGRRFQLVACVPMTRQEQRTRGYNQSAILAGQIAKALGLPFSPDALRKIYETPPQHRLETNQKSGNVLGVFDADPALVADKSILLIDDISTTHSTLNECAKMLKLSGAKTVSCAVVAISANDYWQEERKNEPTNAHESA